MSHLRVTSALPLGIAWTWVKASFATFREKPINFLWFALCYLLFSLLPFFGSFLTILVAMRIYFSAEYVHNNIPFDLKLNLGLLLQRKNIVSFALFNIGYDLISMAAIHLVSNHLGINPNSSHLFSDPRLIYIIGSASIIRSIFFGIAPVVVGLNADITTFEALKLNATFISRNAAVIVLSLFLLIPLLAIPLYLSLIMAISVESVIVACGSILITGVWLLLIIAITSIFCYKLYFDGVSHE
jgi:hypothetical protein